MTDTAKPPKVDSTLSKGLMILENLVEARGGKGVTELSRELELTKSNTFRLLQTLVTLGYVKHREDKTYAATLKTWQVGRASVENLNLREIASPEMAYLSEQTGETIYLAVLEGLEVVYIDKIDSRKPIQSWNQVGGSAPIHCVGTGKAILAKNYGHMRDKLDTNLGRFTDKTITEISGHDDEVKTTLKQGYAFDSGEFRDRIYSFGAEITLPDGEAIAALGISLPDINLPTDGKDRLGHLVRHAADNVSQKLRRL